MAWPIDYRSPAIGNFEQALRSIFSRLSNQPQNIGGNIYFWSKPACFDFLQFRRETVEQQLFEICWWWPREAEEPFPPEQKPQVWSMERFSKLHCTSAPRTTPRYPSVQNVFAFFSTIRPWKGSSSSAPPFFQFCETGGESGGLWRPKPALKETHGKCRRLTCDRLSRD